MSTTRSVFYFVTGFSFLDDSLCETLVATFNDGLDAALLAKHLVSSRLCEKATVEKVIGDVDIDYCLGGDVSLLRDYVTDGNGSCYDAHIHDLLAVANLEAFCQQPAQLPDPDESEFFDTPCKSLGAVI